MSDLKKLFTKYIVILDYLFQGLPIKSFLIFLICVTLNASTYPYFTKDEFLNIEKQAGRISKNRAMDYQKMVSVFKTYNKNKQLNVVNHYMNQLLPQYDDIIQKQEDHWASPKEFLITGYGDCEDYAIIKYFTLLKLKFEKEKLFLTTVYEERGGYHMVLSYFKDEGKPPLILDNLSFKILDLKTRTDIKADTFINETGVYLMDRNYKLKKVAHHSSKYDELIKKTKQNR